MKMTGWKTWSAAIASIASGVAMLASCLASDVPLAQNEHLVDGIGLVVAGLGMIGIGHKIEKSMGKKE